MRRSIAGCFGGLLAIVVVTVSGCSKSNPPGKPAPPPPRSAAAKLDDKAAEIAAAMAELSDEDRTIAEAQKICPVGGGPLGSMGKPFEVTVKGRKVFLCCEGCKDTIERDPDKYLAKLDEQAQ